MIKTYHGSCHCGAVTFEADIDLTQSTYRCNCSICKRTRFWPAPVKPEAFRLLSGEDERGLYKFRENSQNHHVFCKNCGVRVYTEGDIPEIGGAYVSVVLSTLDDLPPAELAAARVQYMNGRDDDWFHTPAETRHL